MHFILHYLNHEELLAWYSSEKVVNSGFEEAGG